MYLYQLSYYSCEDSNRIALSHTKKIGKKEFNNMFIETTLDFLLNKRDKFWWLETDEGYISNHERKFASNMFAAREECNLEINKTCDTEEKWIDKYAHKYYTRFSDIIRNVAAGMVELYGFEMVEYEQSVEIDGWGDIVNEKRGFGLEDEILNRICKKYWKRREKRDLMKKLGKDVVEYNKSRRK